MPDLWVPRCLLLGNLKLGPRSARGTVTGSGVPTPSATPEAGPLLWVFRGAARFRGSPIWGDPPGIPGRRAGVGVLRRRAGRAPGWLRRGFPREAERGGAAGGGRASAGVTGEEEKWAEKSEWTRGGREPGSGRGRRRAGAAPLPRGTPAPPPLPAGASLPRGRGADPPPGSSQDFPARGPRAPPGAPLPLRLLSG